MTEPAVPGVEEIARQIALAMDVDPDVMIGMEGKLPDYMTDAARAILDLFAPILAEKAERDAYEAKLVETGKWLQELAENPPEPNEALKKLFADYKAAGIRSVGLDDDWKDRALAAEAALAGERERCAKLAEDYSDIGKAPYCPGDGGGSDIGYLHACIDIAAAIRAKGE